MSAIGPATGTLRVVRLVSAGSSKSLGSRRTKIGPIMEMYLADVIAYAEAGNVDAGRKVVGLISRLLNDGDRIPPTLGRWLSEKLTSASTSPGTPVGQLLRLTHHGRGTPPTHADDLDAAMRQNSMRYNAASHAYALIHRENWKPDAAYAEAAQVLADIGVVNPRSGRPYTSQTVKRWYYDRRSTLGRDYKLLG